ncbi:site-specific integrase [Nocardia transvalensis]|uniref:site-specific integrase n=1 Tax=Nocardia transvalensis TaxID=37333 RepID=UPI001893EB23|nr:site-specific integrase [Nocardia transvalensis]MBF6331895.1 site-specific integrase [Nocardia transvalensis]
MARLALAARDADQPWVYEQDLQDLPELRGMITEALRRTGLLDELEARAIPTDGLRSCEHCLCWEGARTKRCRQCWSWSQIHPPGTCRRCHRHLPIKNDLCRFCQVLLAEYAPDQPPADQLWFGGELALTLNTRKLGYENRGGGRKGQRLKQIAAEREAARSLSPHLVNPHQIALIEDLPRDWHRVNLENLPALTLQAQTLLDAFDQRGRDQAWLGQTRNANTRVLRILLAWLGAAAPIHEVDVKALASSGFGSYPRVCHFLRDQNLLVPDPSGEDDTDQLAAQRLIDSMPTRFQGDVTAWTRVLRGSGRLRHPVRAWSTIRHYLGYIQPTLQDWSFEADSLRSITQEQIRAAAMNAPAPSRRAVHVGLRSLFAALKQERRIFRDPARGVRLGIARPLPTPLPSDHLRGLIDKTDRPMTRFTLALVAIHALATQDLRHLELDDLDRSAGRLVVRRPYTRHLVFLDELTLTLITAWLRERNRRWPRSANPHLLVTQRTAVDPSHPPISPYTVKMMFRPFGISPLKLRIDRILDEARHSADPVHLQRIFGLSTSTAVKYIRTAHPDLFTVDPIAP